ncbi:glutaminase-asparaginase [Colletotrichum truncatum]|uniref:Glutaminase-asparaginase n=1 Tax=Colletotrichum truncatum TaxID=5467 RepID=A0ACC3YP44_COLTU|nr:glutaminase-asparaginase [Colletotrichum truncatum]XP_036576075.1 glutaminase-asparaginase [Colletotrichum truncatum]KAF6780822.1 glutaminase-asparaginase [Colletotrichum truncatum]KAF6782758.1 glutaminase-asparaginase [Colletotrichum truncatum]
MRACSFLVLLLPVLRGLGVVSPAVSASVLQSRATTSSQRHGLKWLGSGQSLPKILVVFTGGTLAEGSGYGPLDDTQYGQYNLTAEEIIARNPYLFNVSQLAISNWTSGRTGPSPSRSDAFVMNMTRFLDDALCSDDSDIDGAVFTHGTNSLEETAILFDLLIPCDKPIVAAGASRPVSALSADGDANFFQSVSLAASPASRGRGVLIAFSNHILQAFWTTKMVPTFPDGFGQTAGGSLGEFLNNMPYFFNTPSLPTDKHKFDLVTVNNHESYPSLPKVDILFAHREFDGGLVTDAVKRGAKGLVIAGTGSGAVPTGKEEVAEAFENGTYIVVSTRSPYGASVPSLSPTYAKSGYVHPLQARVMLQLGIASGFSQKEVANLFEGTIRDATLPSFIYGI